MVSIPGDTFTMGSPANEAGRDSDETQRRVSVPAFAAGKYEVTWAEWDRCVADGGCARLTADGFGGGSRPVTNVSWTEAVAYAKWLSRKTGKTYRLLSEAEWEYAARAGTTTAYSFGNSISTAQANHNSAVGKTTPVGQYPANAFGLHDMHGNVWEWVEDCYDNSCSDRVIRGGSWGSSSQSLRSASRGGIVPSGRSSVLGFRLARTGF